MAQELSAPEAAEDRFVFNGLDGASGAYLLSPMTARQLSDRVRGVTRPEDDRALRSDLEWRRHTDTSDRFAPEEGVDPKDLAQSGWGVIFPAEADPAPLREALKELLDLRRSRAGDRYREFAEADGYRSGESKNAFLARHGATPGNVEPDRMPYYLLLVGSPEQIPFRFGYELDLQHAVGRLHFDTFEEYASYARSVVAAETGPGRRSRSATFIGVANPDDRPTALSARDLVTPLAEFLRADEPGWRVDTLVGGSEAAAKEHLLPHFGGEQTPAFLFTASHGVGFPKDDRRQLPHQGALVCGDWPGPLNHRGLIPQDYYLAADDITDAAELLGLIAFHFACYGAGVPQFDEFPQGPAPEPQEIAPRAFLAGLPRRLLGHPGGGALAVVGHVERAWTVSFKWGTLPRLTVFRSTLKRLVEGHPVGSALEPFNSGWAEFAASLTQLLETARYTRDADAIPHAEIAELWTATNDARGYAIIGDPAVRLAVGVNGSPPMGRIKPVELGAMLQRVSPADKAVPASPTSPAVAAAATPTAAAAPRETSEESEAVNADAAAYGIADLSSNLSAAIEKMAIQVSNALQTAFRDLTTLSVTTSVIEDMSKARFDRTTASFPDARLVAFTRIGAQGDTDVYVPAVEGDLNEQLLAIHADAVRQAQEHRTALLRIALSLAAGLPGTEKQA